MYPNVISVFFWARCTTKTFRFFSIFTPTEAVTKNFRGSPHIDQNDFSVQYALFVGDFDEGGELCVEEGHQLEEIGKFRMMKGMVVFFFSYGTIMVRSSHLNTIIFLHLWCFQSPFGSLATSTQLFHHLSPFGHHQKPFNKSFKPPAKKPTYIYDIYLYNVYIRESQADQTPSRKTTSSGYYM